MSSGSESDEDYVPGEPVQVSEEDSANEETDLQFEKELEHKTKKRKVASQSKGKQKKKTKKSIKEIEPENTEEKQIEEELPDPEKEKKREDDLWAMFLEGTDTKPKPLSNTESKKNDDEKPFVVCNKGKPTGKDDKKAEDDSKDRERRIFEFAGETIVVENNVIKEKIKTTESSAAVSKVEGPSKGRVSGGLSGVLGQLNKKNQLSTLEKSKLDWVTYKKEEGIEEEIQSHNKGKAGYLERQDFLERADVRQYEIERDLRMSRRRSNR